MVSSTSRYDIDAYRLKFSGHGSEYFRVWIVNILLTIVTLGLYTPWARRRNARYFYGHTLVAGSPLEFTGPLRKMVFGFIIFALLYLAFEIASNTGQQTAIMGFVIAGAVLAPYLWGSAMRFRLSSTRWRGLQLHFSASWKEIYLASWPIYALAAVWMAIMFGIAELTEVSSNVAEHPKSLWSISPALWKLLMIGVLASAFFLLHAEFNYSRLLFGRGGIGDQVGRWKPGYGHIVRIWLATVAFFLAGTALAALLAGVIGAGAIELAKLVVTGKFASLQELRNLGMSMGNILTELLIIVGAVIAFSPARAYRDARLFHMIWNNVGLSQIARFKCQLRPWAYAGLRLRNLLLTVLTLGLFRPIARLSEYRMKVDSVTLYVKGGLDQLVGRLTHRQNGLGDALADAAGLVLIA